MRRPSEVILSCIAAPDVWSIASSMHRLPLCHSQLFLILQADTWHKAAIPVAFAAHEAALW